MDTMDGYNGKLSWMDTVEHWWCTSTVYALRIRNQDTALNLLLYLSMFHFSIKLYMYVVVVMWMWMWMWSWINLCSAQGKLGTSFSSNSPILLPCRKVRVTTEYEMKWNGYKAQMYCMLYVLCMYVCTYNALGKL